MRETDVVIIGSGAAGLAAAVASASQGLQVLVLTKGQVGRSGATVTISGDVAVDGRSCRDFLGLDGDRRVSVEAFFEDTVTAGRFLNDESLVRVMVEEVASDLRRLVEAGLHISGPLRAPGHRYPRGVWASGMEMLRILGKTAISRGVKFLEEFYVTDVLGEADGVRAVAGLDLRSGEIVALGTKAVVIASGGGMMLYPFQTAPEELVGDGYAMALKAGAELVDMEMVQFLPCVLVDPPMWRGIQFPWLLGPQSGVQAWLLNKYGERFMAKWDPQRMESSTRDVISIACMTEILEGRGGPNGGVFLSWAHLPTNVIEYLPHWYGKPHLRTNWKWEGFDFKGLVEDIKRGRGVEVAPASHFFMGGIAIDVECETRMPGLFAAGEVAGGVHGANRLSGNASTQMLVQGRRAGFAAARYATQRRHGRLREATWKAVQDAIEEPLVRDHGILPVALKAAVQETANRYVGIVRNGEGLRAAVEEARKIREATLPAVHCSAKARPYNKQWVEALECRSLVTTLEAVAVAALHREESRGAHYRADFPGEGEPGSVKHTVLARRGHELSCTLRDVEHR